MSLDDDIDQLYQQPLAAFTRERDALAARAGTDGATIRRLQKPSVAAWAVNQVYWRRRKIFERLATASSRLRVAHEQRLAGKDPDVALAEGAHRAAVEAAVEEAAEMLRGSGDGATDATVAAVRETFQTLVWSSLDGRLIRPLKSSGLEAISALMKGPRPAPRAVARVLPIRPAPEGRAETAKREAEAAAKEAAALEKELRSAQAVEDKAELLVKRATAAVDRATAEQAEAEAALEKATAVVRDRRDELHRLRERAKAATAERERIASRLAAVQVRQT